MIFGTTHSLSVSSSHSPTVLFYPAPIFSHNSPLTLPSFSPLRDVLFIITSLQPLKWLPIAFLSLRDAFSVKSVLLQDSLLLIRYSTFSLHYPAPNFTHPLQSHRSQFPSLILPSTQQQAPIILPSGPFPAWHPFASVPLSGRIPSSPLPARCRVLPIPCP